ncbi:MAG TPA: IS701 family transposase [Azospirillaceae bacterium]|nr:IS701 family transposase [Azospirillaceae bacterium]
MAGYGVQGWERELTNWLAPLLSALGHPARRLWAPFYIRGLLGPGERKSVQPMAERLGLGGHDQLHNFIASASWNTNALEAVLAAKADALVGGAGAVLVVDDTALPKKGLHSVGVARQYAGALGKNANNCQTLVSLTLARDEVPIPVALRLFLPWEWVANPTRCAKAGIPAALCAPKAKTDIALEEIDRLRAAGLRFGCVLADAGYGISAGFRQGLDARELLWAVGIPRIQKVYRADAEMVRPAPLRGRPRRAAIPVEDAVAAETLLDAAPWRMISWRMGTKGPLAAECTWPMDRQSPSAARPTGTCLGRQFGWWGSAGRRVSGSTTCPTYPRTRTWRRSPAPSRHAGCASKGTSR